MGVGLVATAAPGRSLVREFFGVNGYSSGCFFSDVGDVFVPWVRRFGYRDQRAMQGRWSDRSKRTIPGRGRLLLRSVQANPGVRPSGGLGRCRVLVNWAMRSAQFTHGGCSSGFWGEERVPGGVLVPSPLPFSSLPLRGERGEGRGRRAFG